jgi:hypothetical protein
MPADVAPRADLPTPREPISGTATERRELRQAARNALGVSRSDAPEVRAILRALRALDRLVWLTTGGRWCVAIVPASPAGLREWARDSHRAADVRELERDR